MGLATFNWRYRSGSLLPDNFTIPTTADDVKASGVTYIAHWGNDTLGNGSRQRPFKTLGQNKYPSGERLIIGGGTWREDVKLQSNQGVFGDGNVIFDISFYSLGSFDSVMPNAKFYNVTLKGNGDSRIIRDSNNITYNTVIFDGVSIRAFPTSNFPPSFSNFNNCTVKNVTGEINIIVNTNSITAEKIKFYNCNNIRFFNSVLTQNYRFVSTLFKNCNLSFESLAVINQIRYSIFEQCNFKITAGLGNGGALFPSVPSGYTYYNNVDTLRTAVNTALGVTNSLLGWVINEVRFNNETVGDFTLANDSFAKNVAYDGTYAGDFSIGRSLKVRANANTSDLLNATAVNLTIADDMLTPTNDALLWQVETKVFENPFSRPIKSMQVLGSKADRNGKFIDATPDLAASTISAGTNVLQANTPYLVETGAIQYNGFTLQPGDRFTTTSVITFTTSAGGVVREIIEAPSRENEEIRFSNGANTTLDNTATLTVGNWYYVESPITYNSVARVAGDIFQAVTGQTSFTGAGLIRLIFETTDPYQYYEIGLQPTSNNVGDSPTGAIIRGNGDKNFDYTPSKVFPISQRFWQKRFTGQPNNLKPNGV